jgi:hypothetical protein
MTALHRLFKLSWIAQKDDGFGCLRYRQDIGQRYLRSLVDEQQIDGPKRVGACP